MSAPCLPAAFLRQPIAHRALHGLQDHCPENSRAAICAAIAAGYGIEIDLQVSSDGRAMVFHDHMLNRLTAEDGPVRDRSAQALSRIRLNHSRDETIPTFAEVLQLVSGRVPLLVEVKDVGGETGPDVGELEAAAIADLRDYPGPVALMSFNPHSMAEVARLAPDMPRGLTTSAFDPTDWAPLAPARCLELRGIPDFDRVGACFVSHEAKDVRRPRVQELRASGVPVLCWTIGAPVQEAEVSGYVDNVTFENYLSAFGA
ncbi:phosphodiesterase [Epibacterium sp. MM17-32]|uniref:glycerophosphodiester phosphodiesterase family protein n=1 Tax=Epibacterium sp. MM17-32 TaxID=2917734 RepID=UPI001EF448BD|nr:glycerophosphodiester phosphodiesterase family protein [Epibacterium sp. MM17-32]MCG7628658.1 phosphodiesterase [Epibacterium sp. MM17-32]